MGMGAPGGDIVSLMASPEVVKLLKLTDDESAFVKLLVDEVREQRRQAFEGGQNLSPEERRERFEKLREQQQEHQKQLAEIIGEQKMARLRQIGMQITGVLAVFFNPELGEKVGLTEDQRRQAREQGEADRDKFREVFQSAQGDPEAMRKGMQELLKQQQERALGLLTDEQKKKWAELQGEAVGEEVLAKIRESLAGQFGGGRFAGKGGKNRKKVDQ
jgi:acyl-CoA reductase-like NAD-dependent aldehyde dehydrogenase